ncbi:MAG: capsid assembly protein, partial [Polyangiales bacterium]
AGGATGEAGGAAGQDGGGSIFDLAGGEAPPPSPGGHPHEAEKAAKERQQGDGKPQRPDDIPEQFWDAEKGEVRVDALVKSHRDLRTKIARGEHQAPASADDYRLPQIEGVPEGFIKSDDPGWKAVREAAHARGVPQADLEAVAAPYIKALYEAAGDQVPPDPEAQKAQREAALREEMAKLGPQGEQMVRSVGTWLAGMKARGQLSGDEHQALRSISNADGVRALAKLRELAGEQPLGIDPSAASDIGSERQARELLREGYQLGEQNPEGRRKIEEGTRMLERLEQAGVALGRGGR